MSHTLFKIFSFAYLRHRQFKDLFQDCLSATNTSIQSLQTKMSLQLNEIQEVLDHKQPQDMSIIYEETDRSHIEQNTDYEGIIKYLTRQFNIKITQLKKIEQDFDKIINIYKIQLHKLAKQCSEGLEKNDKLNKKLKKCNIELTQLKQQIKMVDYQNLSSKDELELINKLGDYKCRHCEQKQQHKQNTKNNIEEAHKKTPQELNKWKSLSAKIQTLRKKVQKTENQLQSKDKIINELNEKIKNTHSEEQELKKAKSMNTTLRGEKMTLNNQISTLRKQLDEKNELCNVLDLEIKKMRVQIDNMKSTMKWQANTIEDLRTNCTDRSKQNQKDFRKIKEVMALNNHLVNTINEEQKHLEKLNKELIQLQKLHCEEIQGLKNRVNQLEMILDEKNECILKLKASKLEKPAQNSYYSELIKVLTKKVADRDQLIRQLQKN